MPTLFEVLLKHNLEAIIAFLKVHPNSINCRFKDGVFPIEFAAGMCSYEIFSFLLNYKGARLNLLRPHKLLFNAFKNKKDPKRKIVSALLATEGKWWKVGKEISEVHMAIVRDDIVTAKAFIEKNPQQLFEGVSPEFTPYWLCVIRRNAEVLKLFFEQARQRKEDFGMMIIILMDRFNYTFTQQSWLIEVLKREDHPSEDVYSRLVVKTVFTLYDIQILQMNDEIEDKRVSKIFSDNSLDDFTNKANISGLNTLVSNVVTFVSRMGHDPKYSQVCAALSTKLLRMASDLDDYFHKLKLQKLSIFDKEFYPHHFVLYADKFKSFEDRENLLWKLQKMRVMFFLRKTTLDEAMREMGSLLVWCRSEKKHIKVDRKETKAVCDVLTSIMTRLVFLSINHQSYDCILPWVGILEYVQLESPWDTVCHVALIFSTLLIMSDTTQKNQIAEQTKMIQGKISESQLSDMLARLASYNDILRASDSLGWVDTVGEQRLTLPISLYTESESVDRQLDEVLTQQFEAKKVNEENMVYTLGQFPPTNDTSCSLIPNSSYRRTLSKRDIAEIRSAVMKKNNELYIPQDVEVRGVLSVHEIQTLILQQCQQPEALPESLSNVLEEKEMPNTKEEDFNRHLQAALDVAGGHKEKFEVRKIPAQVLSIRMKNHLPIFIFLNDRLKERIKARFFDLPAEVLSTWGVNEMLTLVVSCTPRGESILALKEVTPVTEDKINVETLSDSGLSLYMKRMVTQMLANVEELEQYPWREYRKEGAFHEKWSYFFANKMMFEHEFRLFLSPEGKVFQRITQTRHRMVETLLSWGMFKNDLTEITIRCKRIGRDKKWEKRMGVSVVVEVKEESTAPPVKKETPSVVVIKKEKPAIPRAIPPKRPVQKNVQPSQTQHQDEYWRGYIRKILFHYTALNKKMGPFSEAKNDSPDEQTVAELLYHLFRCVMFLKSFKELGGHGSETVEGNGIRSLRNSVRRFMLIPSSEVGRAVVVLNTAREWVRQLPAVLRQLKPPHEKGKSLYGWQERELSQMEEPLLLTAAPLEKNWDLESSEILHYWDAFSTSLEGEGGPEIVWQNYNEALWSEMIPQVKIGAPPHSLAAVKWWLSGIGYFATPGRCKRYLEWIDKTQHKLNELSGSRLSKYRQKHLSGYKGKAKDALIKELDAAKLFYECVSYCREHFYQRVGHAFQDSECIADAIKRVSTLERFDTEVLTDAVEGIAHAQSSLMWYQESLCEDEVPERVFEDVVEEKSVTVSEIKRPENEPLSKAEREEFEKRLAGWGTAPIPSPKSIEITETGLIYRAKQYGFTCSEYKEKGNGFFEVLSDLLERKKLTSKINGLQGKVLTRLHTDVESDQFTLSAVHEYIAGRRETGWWLDKKILQTVAWELDITVVVLKSESKTPEVIKPVEGKPVFILGYENGRYAALKRAHKERNDWPVPDEDLAKIINNTKPMVQSFEYHFCMRLN